MSKASTRVINVRSGEPYDVYIGRSFHRHGWKLERSKWANPFKVGRDGTPDEVIEMYRVWIEQQPELLAAIPELRGKVLACWCKPAGDFSGDKPPQPCHGDVLVRLAEAQREHKP